MGKTHPCPMSEPADTTYRSRLDELLRRYGRKAQTPERDAGTPSLSYSEISARPEKKGSWKKQTTAHKAPKTAGPASRPSSAVNNTVISLPPHPCQSGR